MEEISGKDKLQALVRSRKFWAALVGLIMVVVKAFYPDLPVSEDQVSSLIYLIVAYILGTAVEDGFRRSA